MYAETEVLKRKHRIGEINNRRLEIEKWGEKQSEEDISLIIGCWSR